MLYADGSGARATGSEIVSHDVKLLIQPISIMIFCYGCHRK